MRYELSRGSTAKTAKTPVRQNHPRPHSTTRPRPGNPEPTFLSRMFRLPPSQNLYLHNPYAHSTHNLSRTRTFTTASWFRPLVLHNQSQCERRGSRPERAEPRRDARPLTPLLKSHVTGDCVLPSSLPLHVHIYGYSVRNPGRILENKYNGRNIFDLAAGAHGQ